MDAGFYKGREFVAIGVYRGKCVVFIAVSWDCGPNPRRVWVQVLQSLKAAGDGSVHKYDCIVVLDRRDGGKVGAVSLNVRVALSHRDQSSFGGGIFCKRGRTF